MAESKKKLTYEECRLKRIEENKKRWQELKLTMLAEDVHNATSPKPSPMKKVKPTVRQEVDRSAVRRSNRVADKPPPNYKERSM
ncbi:hypothetical protein H5410_010366 [Solanum commersonii]|uniref:Uncharacterized protein n=1 Tax=Solanum commersonii TaxID=4109 RepID=A0A9J6ALD7_SOLCO|nr:hypothetical protein H5410_010366 [Solanum commersonii]